MKRFPQTIAAVLLLLYSVLHAAAFSIETIYSFPGSPGYSYSPTSALVEGKDGSLYGRGTYTFSSGAGDLVFGLKSNFVLQPGDFGANEPIKDENGNIYYNHTNGSLVRIGWCNWNYCTASMLLSDMHPTNGARPLTALLCASNEIFYGTASLGGEHDDGTIFKITETWLTNVSRTWYTNWAPTQTSAPAYPTTYATPPGIITDLLNVSNYLASPPPPSCYVGVWSYVYEGSNPDRKKINGAWYTNYTYNWKQSYRYQIETEYKYGSAVLTRLHSFDGPSDGASSTAPLVFGNDGHLYGTTSTGGASGYGTVFKISTNGQFTLLHAFAGPEGENPRESLVLAADGNFYGVTRHGGSYNNGTIFKMPPTGEVAALYSFGQENVLDGTVSSRLVEGTNGWLYGTLQNGGGTYARGAIYKISTNGTFVLLHSFSTDTNGFHPKGALMLASNGYFYGTTSEQPSFPCGTIFRFVDAPKLTITANASTGSDTFEFSLTAVAGEDYVIEWSSDMANWTVLTNIPPATVTTSISISDSISGAARFYRVVIP